MVIVLELLSDPLDDPPLELQATADATSIAAEILATAVLRIRAFIISPPQVFINR
jgi:hypothetical protein